VLDQLKELGIELCIDDFGTGYSSLSYLHKFPIDTLKIDRSFVSRIGETGENLEIVKAIVMLARSLRMEVIAEGVETAVQLAQLRAIGCEYGQGYFFSKPLDSDAATALLGRSPKW
jgi:EAL domain-containing protein (putative c-di-GMP-specific phosphodiesterase class I)